MARTARPRRAAACRTAERFLISLICFAAAGLGMQIIRAASTESARGHTEKWGLATRSGPPEILQIALGLL